MEDFEKQYLELAVFQRDHGDDKFEPKLAVGALPFGRNEATGFVSHCISPGGDVRFGMIELGNRMHPASKVRSIFEHSCVLWAWKGSSEQALVHPADLTICSYAISYDPTICRTLSQKRRKQSSSSRALSRSARAWPTCLCCL